MLTFKNHVLIKSVIFHYTFKKINHTFVFHQVIAIASAFRATVKATAKTQQTTYSSVISLYINTYIQTLTLLERK